MINMAFQFSVSFILQVLSAGWQDIGLYLIRDHFLNEGNRDAATLADVFHRNGMAWEFFTSWIMLSLLAASFLSFPKSMSVNELNHQSQDRHIQLPPPRPQKLAQLLLVRQQQPPS